MSVAIYRSNFLLMLFQSILNTFLIVKHSGMVETRDDCVDMYGTDYKSTVLRVYRSKPWAVSVKHSEREFR